MLNFYKILFFNSLLIGTLITISAYSWFSMWIGLEINLLSIIPLLKSPKSLYPSEASMKYFITQSLASMILMLSVIMASNQNEFMPQNSNLFLALMMNSAFFLKLGMAPFHSWFPEVLEGLNWSSSLIMLTWQKIGPMILLTYNLQVSFFFLIIIFSSMVSGIFGINQTSLRKILAYSSINHMAWMTASMLMFKTIWLMYFLIYSLISLNIILMFNLLNIFNLSQLFSMMNESKLFKMFFIMNFLSLGGLPPFLGFFPKWMVINSLIISNFYMISFILIIFTLMPLFFYMRMSFSTMMILSQTTVMKMTKKMNFTIMLINSISLMGLFICTLIFNFY